MAVASEQRGDGFNFSSLKWFIVAGAGAATLLVLYFFYLLGPLSDEPDQSEEYQTVIITPGEGLRAIAEKLFRADAIRSPRAFKIYSFLSGSAHRLKPGEYRLGPSLTAPQIVSILEKGLPADVSVLIVEGATLKEIDRVLSEREIIEPGTLSEFFPAPLLGDYPFLEGTDNLEGFLFPDTYRFYLKSDPGTVARRFLDNFKRQAWPLLQDYSRKAYDQLIMASLIEKEVPFDRDRRLVSGILRKRLTAGVALQADAALVYSKCSGLFEGCPRLQSSDFTIDSPYNIYRRRGLPPTPVGNPGLDAIRAANAPEESSYWYYLSHPETRETVFSRTLEEHNQNRRRYLGFGPHTN